MEAFMFFKLKDQLFAVEQSKILSIGRLKDYRLHPMPTAEDSCLGAVHHQGRAVPVLNTAHWLLPKEEYPLERAHPTSGQLIFIDSRVGYVAFLVDAISHDNDLLSEAGTWQFIEMQALL